MAVLAACQQSQQYGPSNVKPSKFILGSERPTAAPAPAQTVSVSPAPAPVPAPVEAVVLPVESTVSSPLPSQPVYVDITEGVGTGDFSVEESVPALTYEEAPTIAYVDDSAFAVDNIQPVDAFVTEPIRTEVTYIAADPIPEVVSAPPAAPIVEEPAVATLLPSEPAFIQAPSEALEIEVAIPTNLDEIAPPRVVEADFIPPSVIEESALAPLDAPVLPSTEILESELAPPISEAVAPPRPNFKPIPQPGLSNYGSAF